LTFHRQFFAIIIKTNFNRWMNTFNHSETPTFLRNSLGSVPLYSEIYEVLSTAAGNNFTLVSRFAMSGIFKTSSYQELTWRLIFRVQAQEESECHTEFSKQRNKPNRPFSRFLANCATVTTARANERPAGSAMANRGHWPSRKPTNQQSASKFRPKRTKCRAAVAANSTVGAASTTTNATAATISVLKEAPLEQLGRLLIYVRWIRITVSSKSKPTISNVFVIMSWT
jgi:hypothetical protein